MASWSLVCLSLLTLLLHSTAAGRVPAIIVFGDSSVDSGNNNFINTIARSNYEPYGRDFDGGRPTGRFCNGRLASDYISQAFNLPSVVPPYLDPTYTIKDFAVGVNFASAGTGYDNATSNILGVIPMWKELEYFREYISKLKGYQGEVKAMETIREALYLISVGTNDFLENYYVLPGRPSSYTVEEYQSFLVDIAEGFVNELYQLGARKIDLTGILPMGCVPLERAMNGRLPFSMGSCNEEHNRVARDFNTKLQLLAEKLSRERSDFSLVYGDLYDIFDGVIKSPVAYGFDEVINSCCGDTGIVEIGFFCMKYVTCSDADKYVFWDAIHPTQRMNQVLANYIVNTTLARFR
ncbi:hypothetical protein HPP92_004337 [Vanilla planifolia]|uniref:GDSL esterase/lipase n=1 Tax=Vanilla planifolia TaxID=51239 RepID=A0A835VDJ0_VANPL|nr:hypothetical protein HPP92_004337 [Vanilla planifolia]